MAKKPNPSMYTGGFDTRTGRLLPVLTPAMDQAGRDFQTVINNDEFLSNFNTPEDYQDFSNYQIGKTLEKNVGINPFEEYAPFKAKFKMDEDIKLMQIDEEKDDSTTKAFKDIFNDLVTNKGSVASPNFFRKTLAGSMTNGWLTMGAGKDLISKMGEFSTTDKGLRYDGHKLDLDEDEADLIQKYISRVSGEDEDSTFFDKVLETGASLMWDMPLLALTGALSQGAVALGGRTVGQALNITTKGIGRVAGNVAQQAVNFNILGLPQTVQSVREQGIGAGVDSILHNVWMGTVATGTGLAGRTLFGNKHVPVIKEIFKRRPALREELAGLGGSFGFGYVSGKLEGQENEDALAQALAFAGTHFTNPRAYRRVLAEQKNRNIRIKTEAGSDPRVSKDYFVEENGQLYKINKDLFNKDGRIAKMEGYNPIKVEVGAEKNFPFYNEVQSGEHITFGKALEIVRGRKNAKKLVDRWKENVPKEYYEKYRDDLETLALSMSMGMEGIKYRKIFTDWKLPEDASLHNKMVEISERYKIKYSDVKKHIVNNVGDYLKDRENFSDKLIKRLGLGEKIAKDLEGAISGAAKLLTEGTIAGMDRAALERALRDKKMSEQKLGQDAGRIRVRNESINILKKQYSETLDNKPELNSGQSRIKYLEKIIADSEVGSTRRVAAEEVLMKEREAQTKLKEEQDAKKQEMPKGEGREAEAREGETGKGKGISIEDFDKLKQLGFSEEQIQRIPKGQEKIIIEREQTPDTYKFPEQTPKAETPKTETEAPKEKQPAEPEQKAPLSEQEKVELTKQRSEIAKELQKHNPTVPMGELAKVLEAGASSGTKRRLKKGSKEIIDRYKKINDRLKEEEAKTIPAKKKFKAKDKTKAIPKKEAEKKKVEWEQKEDIPLSKERQEELGRERTEELIKSSEANFNPDKHSKISASWAKKVKDSVNNFTDMKKLAEDIGLPKHLDHLWKLMDDVGIKVEFDSKIYNGAYSENFAGTDKRIRLNPYIWSSNGKRGVELRGRQKWRVDQKGLEEVFTHEAIHGLLRTLAREKPQVYAELKAQLQQIQRDVQKQWFEDVKNANMDRVAKGELDAGATIIDHTLKKRMDYMLDRNSYQELVTISLTEPRFAKYLSSIPATEGTAKAKGRTIWNQLTDWVRAFFKAVKDVPTSKLDEITNLLNKFSDHIEQSVGTYNKSVISREDLTREGITSPRGNNIRVLNEKAMRSKYNDNIVEKFNTVEYDARPEGKRKNNTPPKVEEFSKIQAEMMSKDIKDTKASKLVDITPKSFKDMAKENMIIKLHTNLKKYADLNVPPVFYAEMSDKFRDFVYKDGESIIRNIPLVINTILNRETGWNSGHKFNRLMWGKSSFGLGRVGNKEITPEGKKFLEAVEAYELGRNSKRIEKELTWDEFAEWAGFNPKQKEVLNAYKEAMNEAVEQMKYMKTKYITEFDDNPAIGLGRSAVERLLGEPVKKGEVDKAINILNKKAQTDKVLKEQIAKAAVEQSYRGWGKTFYYNGVRPTRPETFLVDVQKVSDGKVTDRISTYFDTKKEVDQFLAEKKAQGYDTKNADAYQIKDLIEQGTYTKKLNAHQLMELANAGHIPLTNEIIQKLMEATKVGVDLHSNKKEYIKGMKYTPKEFETQMDRFVREAIYGSFKGYHLTKINNNLLEWESKLTPKLKKGGKEALLEKLEYDYGQKYLNQLKQPEHSVVDGIRGAAIAMQVGGIKPAFLFQQSAQIFQTTLANAISEVKTLGVGATGDAIRHFNKSLGEAIAYSFARMGEKTGKPIRTPEGAGISAESFKLIKQLEDMGKVGGTGIRELTAETNSLEHKYSNSAGGTLGNAQRTLNFLGKGVEKWTRIQTALTYEKIGRAKGMEGKELLNFMATGIDKSLAEWGKGGRAPIFDSKNPTPGNNVVTNALKKSFLTYKTFAFYNYGMWRSLIQNKQHSALWAKATIGLGMHGITKFPLFASAFLLADLFTDDETDHYMWQGADWLDEKIPMAGSILHRGLGSIAGFDLRQTFGESTPLVTDLYAESWAKSWDGKLVEMTLGAPAGFSKDVVEGLRATGSAIIDSVLDTGISVDADRERRAAKVLKGLSPIFLRNILRAFTLDEDGFEVRGKAMVMKDNVTTWDVLSKALSFPIGKQVRAYSDADFGPEAKYNKAKQVLKKGKTHRKEFTQHLVEQGISGEEFEIAVREEMKQVAKHMNEARETIRELEAEVRLIKRQRKLQENN